MSRAVQTKLLSTKSSTKENAANSVGTMRATRSKLATLTTRNTKGNKKLFKNNVISALRSPVLQDRTNLTLEPTKVSKKGDEKAGTGVTRSNENKFTRSRKSKDDAQSQEIGNNIIKKKTSVTEDEALQDKQKKMQSNKIQNSALSSMKEKINAKVTKSSRTTKIVDKVSNNETSSNTKSLEKNKNIKQITELPKVVKVNTRTTKMTVPAKTEPSSKKIDLTQTKISLAKSRTEITKPSEEVEGQKITNARFVTRSKTRQVKNKIDTQPTTTEDSDKLTKTQSENVIDVDRDSNTQPKSSQNSKKSIKSKIPTKKSTKTIPTASGKRRSSMRIKNTVGDKKFFSNRVRPVGHSKISPLKRAVIGIGPKNTRIKKARVIPVTRESSSFHLRQTTLSESFSNNAKKALRPRNKDKNYCDDSQIANKNSSSNNKNAIAELGVGEKKGPIYKKVLLEESQEKDKEKVYEFIPDKNDVRKKRKKKIVRKAPAKKVKTANVKNHVDTVPIKTLNNIKAEQAKAASNQKLNDKQKLVTIPGASTKPLSEKNTAVDHAHTIEVTAEMYAPSSPEIGHAATDMQKTLKLPEHIKPKIISDQKLQGERCINITGTPLQPKLKEEAFSRPFRETNAFNMKPSMQMKTMMDHPLIRRSLSPISKPKSPAFIEDTGSPWRPAIPSTFSRVKNVFQSTPQGDKFMPITARTALGLNKQRIGSKMARIEEQKRENNNTSENKVSPVKNLNISKSPKKKVSNISKSPIQKLFKSQSPRKFGTEISNINSSDENCNQKSSSKSPRKFGSEISNTIQVSTPKLSSTRIEPLKRPVEPEHSPSIIEIPQRISPIPPASEIDEIVEDKENSAPNYQSPLRISTETIQAQTPIRHTEESVIPQVAIQAIEEFEPQPGPSGLQKVQSSDNAWNFKQTNLNKFLNLPDMPESTRISTAGIFDDPHSTPINGKKLKKISAELDVIDAFGFDELEDSFTDLEKISPINKEPVFPLQAISTNKQLLEDARKNLPQINKNSEAHPMRISIGEIKKTLQTNKEKGEVEEVIPAVNQKFDHLIKKNVVQAINFSDTFDVENKEKNTENIEETIKEIPLFVDLEPVHFTQPPRYSYKRKRHHQSYEETENEDENEEDEEHQKRPQKKKKIGKAEREQKKKLDKWAKDMNDTFEEIDHFDLVVE